MKPIFRYLPSTLLVLSIIFQVACDAEQIQAGASAVSQAAQEMKSEIQDSESSGDINADEAKSLTAISDDVSAAADSFKKKLDGYDKLDATAKRQIVKAGIDGFVKLADRFEQDGIIKLKSEKAQARFRGILKNFRRGASILRIVEAALPKPKNPVEAPSPAPTTR